MTRMIAIVEGDGEVRAVPILLRRITEWRSPGTWIDVPPPIRVRRDRFLSHDAEFHRYVRMAALQAGAGGGVIILLNADDDCPVTLASSIRARAEAAAPEMRFAVVLANREFEAWLIAAAESLVGKRGFVLPELLPPDPDSPRDAKGWIRRCMPGRAWRETTDQPALTAVMDLAQAHMRSRSFRRLCAAWQALVHNR